MTFQPDPVLILNAASGLLLADADGAVDRSERVLLDGLRERLGLSVVEAHRIEREVTRA